MFKINIDFFVHNLEFKFLIVSPFLFYSRTELWLSLKYSNCPEPSLFYFMLLFVIYAVIPFIKDWPFLNVPCVLMAILKTEYCLIKYFVKITLEIFIRGFKTCVVTHIVSLIIKDGCIFSEKLAKIVSVSLKLHFRLIYL